MDDWRVEYIHVACCMLRVHVHVYGLLLRNEGLESIWHCHMIRWWIRPGSISFLSGHCRGCLSQLCYFQYESWCKRYFRFDLWSRATHTFQGALRQIHSQKVGGRKLSVLRGRKYVELSDSSEKQYSFSSMPLIIRLKYVSLDESCFRLKAEVGVKQSLLDHLLLLLDQLPLRPFVLSLVHLYTWQSQSQVAPDNVAVIIRSDPVNVTAIE